MTRRPVLIWWSLVLAMVVVAGAARYEARSAELLSRGGDTLMNAVLDVLERSGAGGITPLRDRDATVGYSFGLPACTTPARVVSMPVTVLAESVARDHAGPGDRYRFHYLDRTWTEVSQIRLTGVWLGNVLRSGLGLSDFRRSRSQLVVLWAGDCAAPFPDWSGVWRRA